MSWEVRPEPLDPDERAVLLEAAERVLAEERESAWWSSGFEDLGGLDETQSVPSEHAARPDAASSVAPVSD